MKELIEYNYDIDISNFEDGKNSFSFFHNNSKYLLVEYKRNKEDINELIDCSKELKIKKIPSLDLMKNKKGDVISNIDGINYILLKVPENYKEIFDIIDIINYAKKTVISSNKKNSYKNNWGELWSEKVDYFEYQISELGKGKDIIIDSFSYFLGLAENAIFMVNKANKNNDYGKDDLITLSHRRVFYPNYLLNYCNPISYIVDLFVRDVAEYIKSCFYKGEDALLEVETFLKSIKLSNYSYQMFFARLIFPSLYFDLYENAIESKEKEEDIIEVIQKVDEYEYFMKNVYILISNYSKIDKVDWL